MPAFVFHPNSHDIQIKLSYSPQHHLQVVPLVMQKEIGAVCWEILKFGLSLLPRVLSVPNLIHGCAWFLDEECTKE